MKILPSPFWPVPGAGLNRDDSGVQLCLFDNNSDLRQLAINRITHLNASLLSAAKDIHLRQGNDAARMIETILLQRSSTVCPEANTCVNLWAWRIWLRAFPISNHESNKSHRRQATNWPFRCLITKQIRNGRGTEISGFTPPALSKWRSF